MKVLLNERGYVESYAMEGDLLDAVETAEPDDLCLLYTSDAADE